jgi:hypothetical protein
MSGVPDRAPRQGRMPFNQVVRETARRFGYDLERPRRGKEMKARLLECLIRKTSGKIAGQQNAVADIE